MGNGNESKEAGRAKLFKRIGVAVVVLIGCYLLAAYVILPFAWKEHEGGLKPDDPNVLPKITHDSEGIPGDPINVGLVGSYEEVIKSMIAAGWRPADSITFESSIKIAESVEFDKPDPTAPVSALYIWDRKQDLAFENEVGSSADRRNHVRFWKCAKKFDVDGRTLWLGDVAYDKGSGVSHLTGQITHHIDADVDTARDRLFADLTKAKQIDREYQIEGVGPTQDGRNAGGDRYFTDGKVTIGVLVATAPTVDTKERDE